MDQDTKCASKTDDASTVRSQRPRQAVAPTHIGSRMANPYTACDSRRVPQALEPTRRSAVARNFAIGVMCVALLNASSE